MTLKVLSVATEWFSRRGGVSTFNREMCAALSRAGDDVYCLVPGASESEVEDASARGVKLLFPINSIGLCETARLCLPIDTDISPDIVIGHDRVTGSAAHIQASGFYKHARRVHVFHTAPEAIEWHKGTREKAAAVRAAERQATNAQLGASASLAIAVGPVLHSHWDTCLQASHRVRVHRVTPGLPQEPGEVAPPASIECLVLGRLEDYTLKGVDIASAAIGVLKGEGFRVGAAEPILVLRGAAPGSEEELRQQAIKNAGDRGIQIVIREYSANVGHVREDLARASVLLMPSRAEGFGLVALEALAMGVPVLVSSRSGFAHVVREVIDADGSDEMNFADAFVVDVGNRSDEDARNWAQSIRGVLSDRRRSFQQAKKLADVLNLADYWTRAAATVHSLVDSIPLLDEAKADRFSVALALADQNPRASIVASTREAEVALENRLLLSPQDDPDLPFIHRLAQLRQSGGIAPDGFRLVVDLLHRRNLAVHEGKAAFTYQDARIHIERIRELLNALGQEDT